MRYAFAIVVCAVLFSGATCHQQIPAWNGKIWVGVPEHRAIERAQDQVDPVIYSDQERFRGVMCFEPRDWESFVNTYVLGCKEWRGGNLVPAYKVMDKVYPKQ